MSYGNMVKKRPGELTLVTWIKNRIDKNENANILTTGPTGSGKSYANLTLALELDPEFDCDTQVVFSFKTLLQTIRLFNKDGDEPSDLYKKKYKVIILEEMQITANAQDWFNKISKLFNMLLSTYRHQNIILFVNTPFSDMINSQAKRMFHMNIEMKGKDEKKNIATIRPKILQWNVKKRDFYEHSIYAIHPTGISKTPLYKIKKPPVEICKRYEELKSQFTNALNKKIEKELDAYEKETSINNEGKNPEIDLNPLSMQPEIWDEAQKGYTSQEELAERIGKQRGKVPNPSQLNRNIMAMRKKGYDIRKYKNED